MDEFARLLRVLSSNGYSTVVNDLIKELIAKAKQRGLAVPHDLEVLARCGSTGSPMRKYRVCINAERIIEADNPDEAADRFANDETIFYEVETELIEEAAKNAEATTTG
jgi:hypothetical protein